MTKDACAKWTSCMWDDATAVAGGKGCKAASAAQRASQLTCTSVNKCECKRPKDLTTMPMAGSMYNHTICFRISYGCNVAQGQPSLSQGTLDVLVF